MHRLEGASDMLHHKPTVIDLCCGAGGFSEGFRQVGFEIIFGVDIWSPALETFKCNQHSDVLEANICDLDVIDSDIIIGSPPCQCFSQVNKSKNKVIDKSVIDSFLKIIDRSNPDYWVMEEVPGILKHFPKLKPLAYNIPAYRYGVEQIRKRVYIGNIPQLPFTPITKKGKYPVVCATEYKGQSGRNFGRLADFLKRKATLEECKSIMGFPEHYEFFGNKQEQYIQIGNAVCPPVSKAIAEGIMNDICEMR